LTAWKIITSPADLPAEYKVVLISNGTSVGVGYYREMDAGVIQKSGFRKDCWVLMWPADDNQVFEVKKWTELPTP
jgi:hypothetical protein